MARVPAGRGDMPAPVERPCRRTDPRMPRADGSGTPPWSVPRGLVDTSLSAGTLHCDRRVVGMTAIRRDSVIRAASTARPWRSRRFTYHPAREGMTNTISTECAVAALVPSAPCIGHNFARCGRYRVGALAQSTLRQDSTPLAGLASGPVIRAATGWPRLRRTRANMATPPQARGAAPGKPAPSSCSTGGVAITPGGVHGRAARPPTARAESMPTGSAGACHAT